MDDPRIAHLYSTDVVAISSTLGVITETQTLEVRNKVGEIMERFRRV